MKVRISSNGTVMGTKVYDIETGDEVLCNEIFLHATMEGIVCRVTVIKAQKVPHTSNAVKYLGAEAITPEYIEIEIPAEETDGQAEG